MSDSAAIMRDAWKRHIAVPAFNIPYLPMVAPVISAVRDQDAFAFIAVARLEWEKFEAQSPETVAGEFEKHADLNHVRLHLDHVPVIDEDGKRVDYMTILRRAVDSGYHSIMIDGSRLTLEENIDSTLRAVELAHCAGIPCEAELGAVMGHEEEGPPVSYEEIFESGKGFTDIPEARRFVEQTGCDWLSVAFGNIHGAIAKARKDREKIAARLDIEHLKGLAAAAGLPLVLHGGSGIIRDYMLKAIGTGIAKVNVATEIRQPYEKKLTESGSVESACSAVYERTVRVLRDYLEIAGKRNKLFATE